jgi:formamidopyrimidine-DNA glycosylase
MSGFLRFSSNKDFDRENIAKHTHVIFSTTNGYLLYNDPRKFGCILFESENNRLPFFDNLGVEPLLEGWNKEYFYEKIKNKNTAIKSLLMNQNIVVGIGNIYATETLFSTKIHPKISGKNITKKQCGEIVSNSIKHLKKAIECGGTTLKDFKNPDGKPGYFANELQVYGREKEKCTKCESIIQKIVISQRSSFFCPSCQKI